MQRHPKLSDTDRSAKVAMTFSGTELTVEAWNEQGEHTEASFDLLK